MIKKFLSLITILTISHSVLLSSKFFVKEVTPEIWDQAIVYLQADNKNFGAEFDILNKIILDRTYPKDATDLERKYPMHLIEFHQELEDPSITALIGCCTFMIIDQKALFLRYATQYTKHIKQELLLFLKTTYEVEEILYMHPTSKIEENKLFTDEFCFKIINNLDVKTLLPDFSWSIIQQSKWYKLEGYNTNTDNYDDDFIDEDAGLKICNFLKQNNNNNL